MNRPSSVSATAPNPGDFPEVPFVHVSGPPLPARFAENLGEAMRCTGPGQTRELQRGVCLDSSRGCHTIVATDGKHLYAAEWVALPIHSTIILPAHKVWTWKGLVADGDWRLGVRAGSLEESPWIRVETAHWTVTARARADCFPDWRRVMLAGSIVASISFEPAAVEFLRLTVGRLLCHDHQTVALVVSRGQVQVASKLTQEARWTSVTVGAARCAGKVAIHLNRELLLKALDFGFTQVEIVDAINPVRFVAEGKQMVLMPVDGGPIHLPPLHGTSPSKVPRSAASKAGKVVVRI